MGGRRHFDEQRAATIPKSWKPSLKTGIAPNHRQPNKEAVKHINFKPGEVKDKFERRHLRDKFDSLHGPTLDNPKLCIRPSEVANQQTSKEYGTETEMGLKKRVNNMYSQRNGMPMASLGDKIYKHPDY